MSGLTAFDLCIKMIKFVIHILEDLSHELQYQIIILCCNRRFDTCA